MLTYLLRELWASFVPFWTALSPSVQGGLTGALLVSPLIYCARCLRPRWFTCKDDVARWQRMAAMVVANLVSAVVVHHGEAGALIAAAFVSGCFAAEGAHSLTSYSHAAYHAYQARRAGTPEPGACVPEEGAKP
jgi:hypothetical protein